MEKEVQNDPDKPIDVHPSINDRLMGIVHDVMDKMSIPKKRREGGDKASPEEK